MIAIIKYRKLHNERNVLGPLVNLSIEQKSPEKEKLINRSKSMCNEYEPQHVCEVCHRIYKLYSTKMAMLLDCNAGLSTTLDKLSQKSIKEWNSEDIKYILDVYGHSLPVIKINDNNNTNPSKGRLKNRNFYFGYQSIIETPAPIPIFETSVIEKPKKKFLPIISPKKREFAKSNTRSSSSSHKEIVKSKEKLMKFENSAAPKVIGPDDMLSLYKSAEDSQRTLVKRLKKSLVKGNFH